MAKPPPTGPHSDLTGVNRDARAGAPSDDGGDGAGALGAAKEGNAAKPDESKPMEPEDGKAPR